MKTTLIIDGNYLLFKDVFILLYMKSLYVDLEKLLRNDIKKLTKMYPFDKIYFVSDSKSDYWRKELYDGYKGTRKQDLNVDWNWVYEKYDELKEELSHNTKITYLEFNKCEGDDIISYLTNHGNANGYSTFIMASDSDLQQLLRFDIHKDYINMIYNFKYSDERLYLPENHNVFLNHKNKGEQSLFDMSDDDEYLAFIDDLKNKTKVSEINTEKLVFCKLVSGDPKDNIKSIYTKGNRGIGKKGGETIYELYKEMDNSVIDFDSDEFINKMIDVIKYNKKIDADDKEVSNMITANLNLNRKLTILKDIYLPADILNEFKKAIKI